MPTPYMPGIVEALRRNAQRAAALAAPDGIEFTDISGDKVTRCRTERRVNPRRRVIFVAHYPPRSLL